MIAFSSYHSIRRLNPSPTHYEVLGLSREATPKEIKDAYLSLSKAVSSHLNLHDWT